MSIDIKKMLIGLIFCLYLFIFSSSIRAFKSVDEFTDSNSLANYTIYENGGTVATSSGLLTISSALGNRRYPYIKLNTEPFTLPFKEVEVRLKYQTVGRFGAGVSIDNSYPTNGMSYDVGHESLLWTWNWGVSPKARVGYYSFLYQDLVPQNEFHTIRITSSSGAYLIYLDDVYINSINSVKNINSLWIGNPEVVSSNDTWPTLVIDWVVVTDSSPDLSIFPFLSQMDSRWVGTEYDSASEWAPLNQRGIGRWGCALTSVAMVLQKYKVKMPDGTEALPDKLNTWLLGNNGYIGPGLVNWIAITRLAKESFDAGKAETKLEFVRTNSTADMKYPAILGLPGHFVLAHDQQVPNWRINDPALNTGGTTLSMSTTIKSVNRFVPSNTDLSYLLFASDNPLDLTFTTATGSAIPLPWTDEHLTDDISGSNSPTMYTAMVPKPENGTYDLRVQNNGNIPDKLMIYMYDEEGLVKTQNLDLLPGETLYTINYDKHDAANSEVAIVDITAPDTPALLLPPNGSLSNKLDLVLKWNTVSDPSAPIEYEYRSGNVTTTSFDNQIDISSWPDGVYDWSVRACDSAKNCSPWSNVWTFTIDNTPPLYVSTTIFDGWYKTTQTATFNYSDSNLRDDYLAPTCEITIEGNAVLCTIDPMVCDRARNCNTETQNSNPAMIDLSPPSSLFTLPSTITNWNGRITGTANDDVSGIQKVELSITKPDASTTTALASGTDNWEYTITNPLEGEYTIYSVASDKAGNSQTEDMKVTLINSIPTAKLPKPPAMLIADDFGQLIIGVWSTAKDAKKYRVYLGTSQREMKQVAETKHSWWVSNKLTKGKYYLGVKSVDKNGNESKMSNVIKIEIRSVFPWRR